MVFEAQSGSGDAEVTYSLGPDGPSVVATAEGGVWDTLTIITAPLCPGAEELLWASVSANNRTVLVKNVELRAKDQTWATETLEDRTG